MDAMEIFRGNFSHIDIGPCVLHILTKDDSELFRQLFCGPEVKRYYVLRDDHSRDYSVLQISDRVLSQKNDYNFTAKWERQHEGSSSQSSRPRLPWRLLKNRKRRVILAKKYEISQR